MNKVVASERTHIAFVGKRNAGKSSLVNKFIGQDLVIVSETPGTTTDPVKKAMELLPYGPVVLVDTAGIDDSGELGEKRISKTLKVISGVDFAIVVLESQKNLSAEELNLFQHLNQLDIPFIAAINKSELGVNYELLESLKKESIRYLTVSCKTDKGILELKDRIIKDLPQDAHLPLVGDIVKKHDIILLVVPIDSGAPKGRIILPQVQTIREALDVNSIVVVVQHHDLKEALSKLSTPPKLVVTDSQAIESVSKDVPDEIPLTTFSIMMARYKGDLREYVRGLKRIDELEDGDKVLISEACSHHAQEDDIGSVKIPRWLRDYSKKELQIDIRNGLEYPDNLTEYKIIIHCGGCML
ncbi:MAG: [FeFe] hydrogenase H-cluster maturation GTPase HydF, partial [Melioribacteraceae bacterium]|nr:[FeFe] hydrogenase H-cluster maturation GTPase HydF [Melioribacteraceae bacterium]